MYERFVEPKVYFVGATVARPDELRRYLEDTGNEDFLASWDAAKAEGLSDAECLCSFFAKLCYKSLTLGQNANVTRVRDVPGNFETVLNTGHGSVLEHVQMNFVVTNCSRVLTHELVRHRIGTAFSQTSGRYVRLDRIDFVFDKILIGCEDLVDEHLNRTEDLVYLLECRTGLRVPNPKYPQAAPFWALEYGPLSLAGFRHDNGIPPDVQGGPTDDELRDAVRWVPNDKLPFDRKKKLTSAIRRVAPNGQSNEIGVSFNLRAIRHVVQTRTAAAAEWEIRSVFNQVYDLVRPVMPLAFYDARERVVDGLREVYGMRMQPYEVGYERTLEGASDEAVRKEYERRFGGGKENP